MCVDSEWVIVSRSSLTSEVITTALRFTPIRQNKRQAKNKTDKWKTRRGEKVITEGKIKVIIFTNLRRKSRSEWQKSGKNVLPKKKVIIKVRSESHRQQDDTFDSRLIRTNTDKDTRKKTKKKRQIREEKKEKRCYRNQRKKLENKYVKKKEVEDVTMDVFFVCVCVVCTRVCVV